MKLSLAVFWLVRVLIMRMRTRAPSSGVLNGFQMQVEVSDILAAGVRWRHRTHNTSKCYSSNYLTRGNIIFSLWLQEKLHRALHKEVLHPEKQLNKRWLQLKFISTWP